MPSGMVVDVDEDNGEATYTINEFEIEAVMDKMSR